MAITFKKAIIAAAESLEERAVLDWLHTQWSNCQSINMAEMEMTLGLKKPTIVGVLNSLEDKGLVKQDPPYVAWESGATFTPHCCVVHLRTEQMGLGLDGPPKKTKEEARSGGTDDYLHVNGDLYRGYATANLVGNGPDYDGTFELRIARIEEGSTEEFDCLVQNFNSLAEAWDAFDDFIQPLKGVSDILVWLRNQEPSYSIQRNSLVIFINAATLEKLHEVIGADPNAIEFTVDQETSVYDVTFERWYVRSEEGSSWPGLNPINADSTTQDDEWPGYLDIVDKLKTAGSITAKELHETFSGAQVEAVLFRMQAEGLIKLKKGAKTWYYIAPTPGGES